MNRDVLDDLARRIQRLEDTAVRYRAGEVSGTGPLDIKLGGSDVAYQDVRTVGPAAIGDQVATLVFGNDLLVLGRIAGAAPIGGGTGALTFTADAHSANATISHDLGTAAFVLGFGVYNDIQVAIVSKSSTNFVAKGWAPGGPITASLAFDWIAFAG